MQGKLTIQDIARLAGVSKATASRVLNRNPSVDPALRERVQQVIREHSFVPNITATGLAGGRTRLLGVLTPPMTWPAVPEILRGVARYIEDTNYEIVLYSVSFERNHVDVLDNILAMRMVAGLLAIFPGELSHHLINRFHQGLPLVMIDDQEEPTSVPWVGIDNASGAYQATRHLLDMGHTRIAYMQGPQSYCCVVERYQGYCQALQEVDITPDPALLLQGSFDSASGRQCALELFARDKADWPSAIFAGNDQMAYGILEVAGQQGIRIPEDISLVGFDDNMLSAHIKPALTTVQQPFFEIGYTAIEMLLTKLDPDHFSTKDRQMTHLRQRASRDVVESVPERIQLPTTLVVRASSAAYRPLSILS
jgi:LacI family transcriptional regulator